MRVCIHLTFVGRSDGVVFGLLHTMQLAPRSELFSFVHPTSMAGKKDMIGTGCDENAVLPYLRGKEGLADVTNLGLMLSDIERSYGLV